MLTATISSATGERRRSATAEGFPLQMDSVLGDKTRRALKEFQRRWQLPRTGELTLRHWRRWLCSFQPRRTLQGVSDADRERIAETRRLAIDRASRHRSQPRGADLFAITMAMASLETGAVLRSAIFNAAAHAAVDALKRPSTIR